MAAMAKVFNLVEGIFWIFIGGCFLVSMVRPTRRRVRIIAATAFAAFGASDFVEIRTGAWWSPWWLLAWKAACLAVMLALLIWHVRDRMRASKGTRS